MRTKRLPLAALIALIACLVLSGYATFRAYPKVSAVKINILTNVSEHADIHSTRIEVRPDGQGVVFFDILGTTDLSSATRFDLEIRPVAASDPFEQRRCCTVSGNAFYGTVQLGSAQYPVDGNQEYTFTLTMSSGALVGNGTIVATTEELTEPNKLMGAIICAIGLLAALLQLAFLFVPAPIPYGTSAMVVLGEESPSARTSDWDTAGKPGGPILPLRSEAQLEYNEPDPDYHLADSGDGVGNDKGRDHRDNRESAPGEWASRISWGDGDDRRPR